MQTREDALDRLQDRIRGYGSQIEELKSRMNSGDAGAPAGAADRIQDLELRRQKAEAALKDLRRTGEAGRSRIEEEIDRMFADIDEGLRRAFAYWK